MNCTEQFRACVRNVRKRNKLPIPSSDIIRKVQRTEFTSQAAKVLGEIESMAAFIADNTADYIDVNKHVPSLASTMTDDEREDIDREVALFASTCTSAIVGVASSIGDTQGDGAQTRTSTPSTLRHRREVVKYLQDRLRAVAKKAEEQRELRQRLAGMTQLRLTEAHRQAARQLKMAAASAKATGRVADVGDRTRSVVAAPGPVEDEGNAGGLAEENASLQAQLEGEVMDVRHVEEQVAQMANLFSVFSNEVLQQHEKVDQIFDDADESKSQVKKGNEELEKNEKAYSFCALFTTAFLYIAGLLLLFVHWFLP